MGHRSSCTQVDALSTRYPIRPTAPGYVNDVFAVVTGGHASGDIGLMQVLILALAATFLGGGLLFGIGLFRAKVLARWAAVLLAAGSVATLALPLLPQVNERLFAIPTGVALVGLGYSLWRDQRSGAVRSLSQKTSVPLNPAGAK